MERLRIPVSPVAYAFWGFVLFILGISGLVLLFRTLMPSLAIAGICLVLGLWGRRRFVLLLIDVWLFAYTYIFLSEQVLNRNEVLLLFGSSITYLTEGFIVASFGATLIGYGLVISRAKTPPSQETPPLCQPRQYWVANEAKNVKPYYQIRPNIAGARESCPFPIVAFILILALVCLYYVAQVVTWEQLLFVGRSQRISSTALGPVWSFMESAVVTFPVMVVYLWRRYKMPAPLKVILLPVVGIAVLMVIASGTRYLLGFQLAGVIFLLVIGADRPRRQWIVTAMLVVSLLVAPRIMLNTRTIGIGNVGLARSLDNIAQPDSYLSAEGILRVNALIHLRHAYPARDRLPENLFIAYWWVPREWWPDKPTMAGYWVIRELSSERGFSEGYSASGGFAMPALLDLGPVLGSLFCAIYGLLIGAMERFAWRERDFRRPTIILAGLLYFAVFFMMRSLHTSLIFLMTTGSVLLVPLSILVRYPRRRGRPSKLYSLPVHAARPTAEPRKRL